MSFFVYILASRGNGTLYVGMTDDLARRYLQHPSGEFPGFTMKYGVKLLVGEWKLPCPSLMQSCLNPPVPGSRRWRGAAVRRNRASCCRGWW